MRIKRILFLLAAVFLIAGEARSQTTARTVPSILAKATSERISIDGRFGETAWEQAEPFGAFRQKDPNEGDPVTEKTQVRILYDAQALYVGAELFDRDPSRIVSRLSRRDDNPDSDYFALYLDPYHDRVTGVMFQVTAAGVQQDSIISNDTNIDNSWDGVWESAVQISDTGWFLEMRIPFSQLRFSNADHSTSCVSRPT